MKNEAQRPLSEQVAQNAERLQAPDSQGAPEWVSEIEMPNVLAPEELKFRGILGGMACAGLIEKKEYIDFLTAWRRDYYGREH